MRERFGGRIGELVDFSYAENPSRTQVECGQDLTNSRQSLKNSWSGGLTLPCDLQKKSAKGMGPEGRPERELMKGRGSGEGIRPLPNMPLTGWSAGVLGAAPERPPGEPGNIMEEVTVVEEVWEKGEVEEATGAGMEADNLGLTSTLSRYEPGRGSWNWALWKM